MAVSMNLGGPVCGRPYNNSRIVWDLCISDSDFWKIAGVAGTAVGIYFLQLARPSSSYKVLKGEGAQGSCRKLGEVWETQRSTWECKLPIPCLDPLPLRTPWSSW